MSQFARRFDQIGALAELATSAGAHWWKDLLSLWRPSGIHAGDYGLRLAIRNGYLNFYRRGQSIARVEIDRRGAPTATTHIKYVSGATGEDLNQEYVKLRDGCLLRGAKQWAAYQGPETLKKWINAVDDRYAGPEKDLVDHLVAANSNVIDLEMGLPAWGDQKTAPRMDLVAIEPSGEGRKIVFWEVKRVTDGRIRCRANVERDKRPEVLKQLADYRRFLNEPKHVELVASAYRNAAKLIVQLRKMADGVSKVHPLGADILAAASMSELGVDREPRLVVLNHKNANQAAWGVHADKLRKERVVMAVIEDGSSLALRPPT